MIIKLFKSKKKKKTEETPKKRIIINAELQEKRIAFMVENRLEDFFIQRDSDEPVAGNIYKGLVKNILPSIQAGFIDIGVQKNGFIHISDVKENVTFDQLVDDEERDLDLRPKSKISISDVLKEKQVVLVQVKKEAIGQKGVRLSSKISLPGRNLVLIPDANQRGISRKITDRKERVRLKELIKTLRIPKGYGIIVRTAGGVATKKNFDREIDYLVKTWQGISKNSKHIDAPTCLHIEHDIIIKTLRDMFTSDVDEIIVDSKEEYYKIKKYFRHFFPDVKTEIHFYKRRTPVFDEYNVEQELEQIFQRKVWLKCGGYIVIDETEALVAIDVNTGRNLSGDNLEETVMKTNLEAAEQIARQLRFRNIGGIIVIDFIDMAKRENRKAVLKKLEQSLAKDKAKTNILPLSEIGLVEMTRQRVKESINQELYDQCEHCKGRGMVKSILSISIESTRKIKRILLKNREKKVKLLIHPKVLDKMIENDANFQRKLERTFRKRIFLEADTALPLEKVKIEFLASNRVEVI